MSSAADRTTAAGHLERMVRRVQAQARVPAVAAAVHRADRALWTCTVGGTGNDTPWTTGPGSGSGR